eukprot:scaffold292401_cov23-Prasinocladus_malaysianus.AAC.1
MMTLAECALGHHGIAQYNKNNNDINTTIATTTTTNNDKKYNHIYNNNNRPEENTRLANYTNMCNILLGDSHPG